MKPPQGHFDIQLPMVRTIVGFFYGKYGRQEMDRWMTSNYPGKELITNDDGGYTYLTMCWVCDCRKLEDIVHELHHVVCGVSKSCRIYDEEFRAYAQGYLFEIVVKRLRKRKHIG